MFKCDANDTSLLTQNGPLDEEVEKRIMEVILEELPSKFANRRCSEAAYKIVLNPSLRKPRKPRGKNAQFIVERVAREKEIEEAALAANEEQIKKIDGICEASQQLLDEVPLWHLLVLEVNRLVCFSFFERYYKRYLYFLGDEAH